MSGDEEEPVPNELHSDKFSNHLIMLFQFSVVWAAGQSFPLFPFPTLPFPTLPNPFPLPITVIPFPHHLHPYRPLLSIDASIIVKYNKIFINIRRQVPF